MVDMQKNRTKIGHFSCFLAVFLKQIGYEKVGVAVERSSGAHEYLLRGHAKSNVEKVF